MEWKVVNALSRDVEREQLNRILKDIKARFEYVQDVPVRSPYTPPVVQRPPLTVTLTGDVTGTATGSGSLTIETSLEELVGGLEDAPDDGSVYWRGNQQWQVVPLALQVLDQIEGEGLLALSPAGVFENREIVGTEGEIDVENGTGIEFNPTLSLADVPDVGGGVLQKTEFDTKGRKVGTSSATTDDLSEGAENLYFTDERAVDAVQQLLDEKLDYTSLKDTLVAGTNILLTADDTSETITISSTGGGGGGVDAVLPGSGIFVDSTDPTLPVVALSSASQAALALATTSLQSGDNVSELVNDAGYLDDATAFATTAQGALADSAVQPGDLADVATSGDYNDLLNKPTIGTGSVTSVAASVPTGLTVTGTPITTAGTLSFSWSSGYQGYTTTEATKLAGIASGAQVNVATNLAQGTRTATTVPVTSSTGASATLGAATTALAGVMSAADKTKLDGIEAGATAGASWGTNLSGIPTNITLWASIAPASKAERVGNNTFTGVNAFQNGSVSGGMSVGAEVNSSTVTNGTRKIFRATMPAYNNSTVSPMFVFGADVVNTLATNVVRFGGWGGASGITAATRIIFSTGSVVDEMGGVDRWEIDSTGSLFPLQNNAYNIGSSFYRIREVFAANGTINTSDAREKTVPRDMTPEEIACGLAIARLPCIFQWLDAIEEKGEDVARLHAGPTVQAVIATMESHDLDPFRYSFVCYDAWPEQPEVVESWDEERDEEGNVTREAGSEVVQEYRPAGDRYSLRPSELESFCRRALIYDRDLLEARLMELEARLLQ